MDLGLAGRKALVCAASSGLGLACATALAREGAAVTVTGRDPERLKAAAEAIRRETGASVTEARGDISTEAGRDAALAACPSPDILVNNNGGPPLGDFRDWSRDQWIAAIDANMLAPIALMRATVDGMCERRFGRIVNITSAMVKSAGPLHGLSTGARAGLMAFAASLARQVAERNVTINNLLPGPFVTPRLKAGLTQAAERRGVTLEAAMAERAESMNARRLGDPAEFGAVCAFLCSVHAGYLTGQDIALDGASFRTGA